MKFKHNKKRNTAFLYEVLIFELAKSVKNKDNSLRENITNLLKKSFHKNTNLGKELKIFKAILESKDMDDFSSERVLRETKIEHSIIDKEKLFKEQNDLYFKIKKLLGTQVFSNFIPNYKDLATISQIFNKDVPIKTRVLLESEIIKKMTSKILIENKLAPIDNIVLNSFIKRFNEEYKDLYEEQKNLLNQFISSFADNGLGLKLFLNEEISRLKTEIKESLSMVEFKEDPSMLNNAKSVMTILENFASSQIDEKMISQVIKIQNLIREIKNGD